MTDSSRPPRTRDERLARLIEQCGETTAAVGTLIKHIGQAGRFGMLGGNTDLQPAEEILQQMVTVLERYSELISSMNATMGDLKHFLLTEVPKVDNGTSKPTEGA